MLSPSARLLMVEIAAKTIRIIPNVLQSPRFSAFSPANPATSPRIILIRLKTIKKAARATPAPTLPAAPPDQGAKSQRTGNDHNSADDVKNNIENTYDF